jgi:uncharacterized protein (TIGR02266 family)
MAKAKKKKKPQANAGPIRRSSGTRLRAEVAPVTVLHPAPAAVAVVESAVVESVALESAVVESVALETKNDAELEVSVPSQRDVEEVLVAYAEEQRASDRVAFAVEINLASDSQFFSGLSGDISEGGLFLSTYKTLPVGSAVDLEFSLPSSDEPLHARGVVRWLREHSTGQPRGVGIAFDALSEEDRERIHRFCSMRPPLYYEDLD